MKNFKAFSAIAFVCCILFSAPADASDYSDIVVSLQINNPIMQVNGVQAEIDPGNTTTPIVYRDRTLVPIRAIIEAFGGNVSWAPDTQTVSLDMAEDCIRLVINSNTAYLNNTSHYLDASPIIVNERTMLPIRFIAEGFNLGVAWDPASQTVSIIRNEFDDAEYNRLMSQVSDYSGFPYIEINNNSPYFADYEIIPASFEYYSNLDELGRCDVCMSSVSSDIMPSGDRESISSVTPTGWINKKYDSISGGYLYNRCHLIGYQLTGENANKRNLITGTRYLNIDGMLPFENMVDSYIDRTGNHVMYRVTPVFTGNNLLADGVLMEAYSVEDNGSGISFCVYCYNTQPSITLDYSTGNSWADVTSDYSAVSNQQADTQQTVDTGIYRTPNGNRYHYLITCGGSNSYEVTLDEALSAGLTPCGKCVK